MRKSYKFNVGQRVEILDAKYNTGQQGIVVSRLVEKNWTLLTYKEAGKKRYAVVDRPGTTAYYHVRIDQDGGSRAGRVDEFTEDELRRVPT